MYSKNNTGNCWAECSRSRSCNIHFCLVDSPHQFKIFSGMKTNHEIPCSDSNFYITRDRDLCCSMIDVIRLS